VTAPSFPVGVGSEGVEVSVDFVATALGRSEATLVLHTSVPFQPALYLPLVARVAKDEDCRLSLLPRLRFGLVQSGRTYERTLTPTNTGGRDCMVWGIELDPAGSARFSLPEPPGEAVIFSGERLEIPVAFAAEVPSLDVFTTSLRFRSSDFAKPEVEVPVSGYAPGLEVYAEPETVDFGLVPIGTIRHAPIRIENRSLLTPDRCGWVRRLEVRNDSRVRVDLEVRGLAPPFEGPSRVELPVGQTLLVPLRFRPTQVGATTSTITFDGPIEEPIAVTLSGIGAEAVLGAPESLDFGAVRVGETGVRSLTLRNDGLLQSETRGGGGPVLDHAGEEVVRDHCSRESHREPHRLARS
jgi:hypothetical protein